MLKRLTIENFAIIKEVDLHFGAGFTVITGETGAGKSILLGALNLITGMRADQKSIGKYAEKCIVEAFFEVSDAEKDVFFAQNDLDFDSLTCVRRELYTNGKSRAFINDVPVSLALVKNFTESRLNIGSQFETFALNDTKYLLQIIDSLAEVKFELLEYKNAFETWKLASKTLEQLQEKQEKVLLEKDYKTFLFNELETIMPLEIDEQITLENTLKTLQNAEEILGILSLINNQIHEADDSFFARANQLKGSFAQLIKLLPDAEGIANRFLALVAELQDISFELGQFENLVEPDPDKLQQIDFRLSQIYKLQQKHRVQNASELLDIYNNINCDLNDMSDLEDDIRALSKNVENLKKAAQKSASNLSYKRQLIIADFEQKLKTLLNSVGMPNAQVVLNLQTTENLHPSPFGFDNPLVLFSANKGTSPQPIASIASGGERSRVLLCMKSLIAQSQSIATILFDEIDTGISGSTTLQVAKLMQQLSKTTQLITITHQAPLAAAASHHLMVFKTEENGQMQTQIKILNASERASALATLISGNDKSEAVLQSVREMIAAANNQ